MKPNEFFKLNNFRGVLECCGNCKYMEKFYPSFDPYYKDIEPYDYCAHPDINKLTYPAPVDECNICNKFELRS